MPAPSVPSSRLFLCHNFFFPSGDAGGRRNHASERRKIRTSEMADILCHGRGKKIRKHTFPLFLGMAN